MPHCLERRGAVDLILETRRLELLQCMFVRLERRDVLQHRRGVPLRVFTIAFAAAVVRRFHRIHRPAKIEVPVQHLVECGAHVAAGSRACAATSASSSLSRRVRCVDFAASSRRWQSAAFVAS